MLSLAALNAAMSGNALHHVYIGAGMSSLASSVKQDASARSALRALNTCAFHWMGAKAIHHTCSFGGAFSVAWSIEQDASAKSALKALVSAIFLFLSKCPSFPLHVHLRGSKGCDIFSPAGCICQERLQILAASMVSSASRTVQAPRATDPSPQQFQSPPA